MEDEIQQWFKHVQQISTIFRTPRNEPSFIFSNFRTDSESRSVEEVNSVRMAQVKSLLYATSFEIF